MPDCDVVLKPIWNHLYLDGSNVIGPTKLLREMTADTPVDLVIPSEINDVRIIAIRSNSFMNCKALRSLIIDKGIENIWSYAFYGCTLLNSISIPDTMTGIAGFSFGACTELTSVSIPSSVTNMPDSAFIGCTALKTININKPTNSITGAPWGATNARVNWLG